MKDNKVAYHTNFTGIKYNNNPLEVDVNSFANANNVYLNKYGALISRPPLNAQTHSYLAYSPSHVNNLPPVNLKLVGIYHLSNDGEVYVIFNTSTSRYTLRYKNPAGAYSYLLDTANISLYSHFILTQYKQYYILFSIDGAKVLDTTTASNSWVSLSTIVDIPITVVQTGNEMLTLPGNQLTGSHKKQFVLKPDSDDTIYNLPIGETATIVFPSQTDVTYTMADANEYTRDRVLRKLNTPANMQANAIVSMVGEKIAIAHSDRVDISLDYGNSFQTIVYPTTAGPGYKNTASLSDDGQCFFYVHTNGVYRLMLGIPDSWELIKVVLDHSFSLEVADWWDSLEIEREVKGVVIDNTAQGANYCHFVNAEKFTFMLAHYRPATTDWISVCYTLGTNHTNLFDQNFVAQYNLLTSFATVNNTPINIIGANTDKWVAEPHRHNKVVRILDNDTVSFTFRQADLSTKSILLKALPTHLWLYKTGYPTDSKSRPYVNIKVDLLTAPSSTVHPNDLAIVVSNHIKLLMKAAVGTAYWHNIEYEFSYSMVVSGGKNTYVISVTVTHSPPDYLTDVSSTSDLVHRLSDTKYLVNVLYETAGRLLILDDSETVIDEYALPIVQGLSQVIVSGSNYLVYNTADNKWYTNIPILATLTYTYIVAGEFTQVPTAFFNGQNFWLGMDKTIWIGNLIDDKLSMPPINNNVFSKPITAIRPLTATSKAIFFSDSLTLSEEVMLGNGVVAWQYHPLKFTVGVRQGDTVITTSDGKFTIFPTKYGLAVLTYQLDIASTEQAITYLSEDVNSLWSDFYTTSSRIKILHHNTQLILSNGTNKVLIYDFRTNGWYPLTFPTDIKISEIQPTRANYEILDILPLGAAITSLTGVYQLNKEHDELYSYASPYKDLSNLVIPWHLTSQLLLLAAPNNYKNISQLTIDQVDSHELKQSAYLTTQIFRQHGNTVKPSIELVYDIDTFAKIIKKVNWWKVLGLKWQLENDANSSYPTQLRLYNVSVQYDISYEVK